MTRLPGTIGATGVVVLAAGLAAGITQLATPTRVGATSTRLPAALGAATLSCPGPETLRVPEGGRAVSPGGAVVVTGLVTSRTGPSGATITLSDDESGPAASAARTPPGGALRPTAGASLELSAGVGETGVGALAATRLGPVAVDAEEPGNGRGAAIVGAVQSTLARSGDLRGLTATACGPPAADTWLVGGGTRSGERLRLLLTNPAATPSVVDVSVLGPDGRVEAPAGDGIAVPAHGQVPVLVDALAPGLERVAVHVVARSGRVRATLHDSLLRGLLPGGVDDVPPAAAPATKQYVPGISLVNGFGKGAGDTEAAGSTSVRVAVPGAEEAVVRVRLLDSTGTVRLPEQAVVNVSARSVVDVPVAGVPSGTYTAVVESDVPVVAGAMVGRRGGSGRAAAAEFGWAAGASELFGGGFVALPPAARSTLSLASLSGRTGLATVTEVTADGELSEPRQLVVGGGRGAAVALSEDAVGIRLEEFEGGPVAGSVVATVESSRGSMITVLPIEPAEQPEDSASASRDDRVGLR